MEKEAALALWGMLEEWEFHLDADPDDEDSPSEGWDLPVFNVRLDATIDEENDRSYRVRVTSSAGDIGAEWWSDLLDEVKQANVIDIAIQNNGIELS